MTNIGSEAPDFEILDNNGQLVKLSSFRGSKNVLLLFYPFAFLRRIFRWELITLVPVPYYKIDRAGVIFSYFITPQNDTYFRIFDIHIQFIFFY